MKRLFDTRRRGLALSCAGVLLLPAVTGAVADEQSPPVFKAETDVVNLTVTVRDADGHFVSNLAVEDFAIYEDGRLQPIQLFAPAAAPGDQQALGLDLGLLVDTSASMAQHLKLSQEEAMRFLEAVPRARDLLTIFFDSDIRISRFDSEHQQGLFERILDSKASGDTALYDAIAVYLSRAEDASGRKVLVLLTDGEDTRSSLTLSDLMQLVRSSRVTIYTIAFPGEYAPGSPRGASARAFMRGLAQMTGGDVFAPVTSKDLPRIYDKILDELSAQYVLGFRSDNARRDGAYRKLRVELKRKELRVRHREGYYAPADAGASGR